MKEKKSSKFISWFIFALLLIFVYKTLDNFENITTFISNLMGVLMPFIVGILIAYILYIPARSIEECLKKTKLFKKKSRGISVLITYIIAILVIIILMNFILPVISTSVLDLVSNIPSYYGQMYDFLENVPEDSIWTKIELKGVIDDITRIDFKQYLSLENVNQYIKGIVSIVSIIFDIFITVVMSVYTLLERERIVSFLKRLAFAMVNTQTFNKLESYFNKTNEIFYRYISAQVIDAVIVGVVTSIAMWMMGVKYAILFGFLIGLFNLIPYIGAIVAVTITVFITIFTGGINKAIWSLIIILILQQIDANIINPKIIGDRLQISRILIIFSVTFSGAYFGILGMFLSVPIIAVIRMILLDYIETKNEEKNNIGLQNIEEKSVDIN